MKSVVLPSQAYEVKLAPHSAPFSVLKFDGHDAITHTIPVAYDYRGDATNAGLANQGFQFQEKSLAQDVAAAGDRALHRQRYGDDVLNIVSDTAATDTATDTPSED